jgi:hypothetical protein
MAGLLEGTAMTREEPPDDNWGPLARYERGIMTFLFILAAAVSALIIWLGWNLLL